MPRQQIARLERSFRILAGIGMPLRMRWSYFDKETVAREIWAFGVYELGNDDDILYVGEGRVYQRLMSHFPNGLEPVVGASYYRVEYTWSKDRCRQRQNAELAKYMRDNGRLPRFNHQSRS